MSASSGAGQYAPFVELTPDNQGAAVIIVAYFLIATTAAFTFVRFAIGRQRLLAFDLDDVTYTAAVFFAILTSVISHLEVDSGLGRHQDTLSKNEQSRYFKYAYAAEFTGIAAMAFAKVSVLLLFHRIMSNTKAKRSFIILSIIIAIYFIFCVFATAFQWGADNPWIFFPSTCSTHGNIRYAVIGVNMVTDIVLAIWILPSLWKLNMSQGSRMVVMALFGARLVVPGAAVGQIVLAYRALASDDQTWVELPYTILLLVVAHVSVIHATLPRIHGFLLKMQTGMLTAATTGLNSNVSTGRRPSNARRASGADQVATIGSDERGKKSRTVDGRLFVSSSSYDYPLPDEKDDSDGSHEKDPDRIAPIPEEAEGNYTDGLKLRPDIPPGSKWSTTIYADHESGKDRTRAHSSSTRGEENMQMGTREDEENSQTSIYEDHGVDAPPIPRSIKDGKQQSHIWKTKEFSYQVEKMQRDGNLVNVTQKEKRQKLGMEMTELARA